VCYEAAATHCSGQFLFQPFTPCHLSTGTGLTPCHICAGTGLTPCHVCAGTGLTSCHICAGTGRSPLATSAPGLGAPWPRLHRDWAHILPHLHRDWAIAPGHVCTGTRRTLAASAPGLVSQGYKAATTSEADRDNKVHSGFLIGVRFLSDSDEENVPSRRF
jgi:hypothetical protein